MIFAPKTYVLPVTFFFITLQCFENVNGDTFQTYKGHFSLMFKVEPGLVGGGSWEKWPIDWHAKLDGDFPLFIHIFDS